MLFGKKSASLRDGVKVQDVACPVPTVTSTPSVRLYITVCVNDPEALDILTVTGLPSAPPDIDGIVEARGIVVKFIDPDPLAFPVPTPDHVILMVMAKLKVTPVFVPSAL